MIVAVEGPNCSGKSTLCASLRRVLPAKYIYVPRYPASLGLDALTFCDDVLMAAVCSMYSKNELYVIDRFAPITYLVRGEGRLWAHMLLHETFVVYMDTPLEVMELRQRGRPGVPVDLPTLKRQYDAAMSKLNSVYFAWNKTPEEVANAVQTEYNRRTRAS